MSSDTRLSLSRRALILGALALGGCGFRPVYGTGGVAQAYRNAVALDAPDTPDGYVLRQQLQDRLGQVETQVYRLTVTIEVTEKAVGIATDNSTTRINLPGVASFRLTDLAGNSVTEGEVSSFTSYSTTSTTVSTRAAAADARARLMTLLADMIVTRLMAAAATRG